MAECGDIFLHLTCKSMNFHLFFPTLREFNIAGMIHFTGACYNKIVPNEKE